MHIGVYIDIVVEVYMDMYIWLHESAIYMYVCGYNFILKEQIQMTFF